MRRVLGEKRVYLILTNVVLVMVLLSGWYLQYTDHRPFRLYSGRGKYGEEGPVPAMVRVNVSTLDRPLYRVSGFRTCTHLDHSYFDGSIECVPSHASLASGMSARRFTTAVDRHAERLGRFLQKSCLGCSISKVNRLSCLLVVSGTYPVLPMATGSLLFAVQPATYFVDRIPTLESTGTPDVSVPIAYTVHISDMEQVNPVSEWLVTIDDGSSATLISFPPNNLDLANSIYTMVDTHKNVSSIAGHVHVSSHPHAFSSKGMDHVFGLLNRYFEISDLARFRHVVAVSPSSLPSAKQHEALVQASAASPDKTWIKIETLSKDDMKRALKPHFKPVGPKGKTRGWPPVRWPLQDHLPFRQSSKAVLSHQFVQYLRNDAAPWTLLAFHELFDSPFDQFFATALMGSHSMSKSWINGTVEGVFV